MKEEETARRRAARMPNFGGGSTAPSTAAKSVAGGGAGTTIAGGDATVNATAVAAQGLDGGKWEPEVQGPAMTFETDRLLMEEVAGGLCERRMSCMNIGSTAIYYRCARHSTLRPQPSTLALNTQPSALNPQPSTPQPSTLSPQPSALNPQPSTLNLSPTLDTQRSTPIPQYPERAMNPSIPQVDKIREAL